MADMVNHPPHYSVFPEGFTAECIEYSRLLGFSQGNAFKYVYRFVHIKLVRPHFMA